MPKPVFPSFAIMPLTVSRQYVMPSVPAPADYYHTRRDVADIIKPETIERIINVALHTVFDFDENGIE